jgi:hypothetical protein
MMIVGNNQCQQRSHFVTASLFALLVFTPVVGQADLLSQYPWQNRLLLVFSESAENPEVEKANQSIDDATCELTDRDMVIGWLFSDGESRIGAKSLQPGSVAELQQRLRISPQEFQAVLIGKDGGVKTRYKQAPALSEVFDLIDGMPMRPGTSQNC